MMFRPLAALLLAFAATAGWAQAPFPVAGKPVRVLIGFAPGGAVDIQARIMERKLSEALGATVIIENKPGANGMLAASEVARAVPDGHTLLYTFAGTFATNPHIFASQPYDTFKDFTPISLASRGPNILVAHVSVPANNVAELVAYAKANPGKLSIASVGTGTSTHVFAEMLMRQTGIELIHIPYKGAGDAARDLMGGTVQLMFDGASSAIQNVKSGRLKMLGIVAKSRSPVAPDVATITEQGIPGIDLEGWQGYFGPAGMARATVMKLNAALAKTLADPEVRRQIAAGASAAQASSPEQLATIVRDDFQRWGAVLKELGIKAQ